MTDRFKTHTPGMTDPIIRAEDVTPDDANDLTTTTRAIFLGASGDLRVTLSEGDIITFVNAGIGWHPIRATRIWATGTTAASILACS